MICSHGPPVHLPGGRCRVHGHRKISVHSMALTWQAHRGRSKMNCSKGPPCLFLGGGLPVQGRHVMARSLAAQEESATRSGPPMFLPRGRPQRARPVLPVQGRHEMARSLAVQEENAMRSGPLCFFPGGGLIEQDTTRTPFAAVTLQRTSVLRPHGPTTATATTRTSFTTVTPHHTKVPRPHRRQHTSPRAFPARRGGSGRRAAHRLEMC